MPLTIHLEDGWHEPATRERLPAILRLLARLEFVASRHLHQVIFPDHDRRTLRQALSYLLDAQLIWRAEVPYTYLPGSLGARNRRPPPRDPYLYGLAPAGRSLLRDWGLEPETVLRTTVVRHPRAPLVRRGQLRHDLEAIEFCVSALATAARCRQITGIQLQLECVTAMDSTTNQPLQRLDALLVLALAPHDTPVSPWVPWDIPWVSGSRPERALRLALEIDRSTESLAVLRRKAVTYRYLTERGIYQQGLGGDVLPVVITPTQGRADQIRREWAAVWPGGPGAIASVASAFDADRGVLWGHYLALGDGAARPVTLWESLGIDRGR